MAPLSDPSLHVAPPTSSQVGTPPSASNRPITIIVTLQPKPNHLARLLDLCIDIWYHSKEYEAGCTISSIYLQRKAQEGKERKIYLFQKFIDEEAFQDHVGTEEHASVLAEIKDKDMLEESIVQSEFYMENITGFDKSKPNGTYDSPESKRKHRMETKDYWGWDVVSVLHPKHGAVDDVVQACSKAAAFSIDEPGCRKMEVYGQCYPPRNQPAKVILMERYVDHAAFEAHLQTEDIAKLMRHCETKLLAKPIEPEKAPSDLCWGFDNE